MATRSKDNKPSRSEIESALGGNQKRSRRKPSPKAQDDRNSVRRQRVIGGDPSGIQRHRNRSFVSRLLEFNFVNLIAISMVLAILAVFFWPIKDDRRVKEVTLKESNLATGYQGVERIDSISPTQNSSFTQPTDIERATEFRLQEEQQRQVSLLLNAAQQHITAGEYSLPDGDNAISKFRQVLQIDNRNRQARDGLQFIQDRFLTNGLAALTSNNPDEAKLNLEKINNISGESEAGDELQMAIKAYQSEREITNLLGMANTARKANNLILPARENALYYYQQVLELMPENEDATAGIQAIADAFVSRANKSIIAGDLIAANGYIATVSVIDSEHPSIALIESMIKNAKPLANELAAQRTAREEARKKALEQTKITPPTDKSITNNWQTNNSPPSNTAPLTSVKSTSLPRKPTSVSNSKTPQQVAKEREEFDRRYLAAGLESYYKGEYNKSAALLQPLADKGVSRAQFRVGYMHFLGRGFNKDRAEADRIIRAALPAIQRFANEGRAWAQSDLGSLYEDGLVLSKDISKALYWYRLSANQGYAGAQTNLGVMYANGIGVSANQRIAISWFKKAARQGDIAAKRNLEKLGFIQ